LNWINHWSIERRFNSISVAVLSGLIFISLLSGCNDAQPNQGRVMPVAQVRNLMLNVVIPTSKIVFESAADQPANSKGWNDVVQNAEALFQSATKLAAGAKGSQAQQWVQISQDLEKAARSASQSARNQDVEGLTAASGKIYEACESCHQVYLPKKIDK
jgi:cytochrome c556